MSVLSRTVTVLNLVRNVGADAPLFRQLSSDPGDDALREHRVYLDPEVWEDMGRPDTITVTVEPGDLLNF